MKEGWYLARDEYPETVANMYELMAKHAGHVTTGQNPPEKYLGMLFTQKNSEGKGSRLLMAGTDGKAYNVECYNCHNFGHYASQCSEATGSKNTGVDLLQKGALFVQSEGIESVTVNKDCIFLDTCSMDNICNNKALLKNIQKCGRDDT